MTIKTKFDIGDKVVAISSHRLQSFEVVSVTATATKRTTDGFRITEHYTLADARGDYQTIDGQYVFADKSELINSLNN